MKMWCYSRFILSSLKVFNPKLVAARHAACQSISECNESESIRDQSNAYTRRKVALTPGEYSEMKQLQPDQPPDPHFIKVSILGEPNVGKSTLTNALVKWKVCPVSKKVHTTRRKMAAVFVEGNKQIEFLDTPGFVTPIHGKKHHLEVSLVADPETSVREADLIAVMVDATNKWTNKRIHPDILSMLNSFKGKKSILILNKVDAQKKKQEVLVITKILTQGFINGIPVKLEEKAQGKGVNEKPSLEEIFARTEKFLNAGKENVDVPRSENLSPPEHSEDARGWPFFSRVFMVSALKDDGVDELREFLCASALPGDWMYHESQIVNKHPHELAIGIVRQVLLEDLPQEIPYNLQLKVIQWEMNEIGCLRITIMIKCPKMHYKRLLLGKGGQRIAKFVEATRQSLQDTFRSEIYLRMAVQ